MNGEVTGKKSVKISCSHSYQCNCVKSCSKDSNGRETCYDICQICYDHLYDIDWMVYSNIGNFIIDRLDRQGLKEPPRWSIVKIGDPVSKYHNYDNYIKASPDTLFRDQGVLDKYKNLIPKYPDKIYDYYRVDRLVEVGTNVKDKKLWNQSISELNKKLGPAKEANLIIVFTTQPHEYFYALRQAWIGGKKNEIGLKNNNEPIWDEIMAWSQNKNIEVKLRDEIMAIKIITPETLIPVLKKI